MTCRGPSHASTPRAARLVLYEAGHTHEYPATQPRVRAVVQTVESLLVRATGILRWVPSPALLDSLKSHGTAVEVVYSSPQTLVVALNGETLRPTRLLLPLEGEWIDPETHRPAILFHGYPEYSGAPYQNSEGLEPLLKLLKDLKGRSP